jgi:hypothetical protein
MKKISGIRVNQIWKHLDYNDKYFIRNVKKTKNICIVEWQKYHRRNNKSMRFISNIRFKNIKEANKWYKNLYYVNDEIKLKHRILKGFDLGKYVRYGIMSKLSDKIIIVGPNKSY